MKRRWTCADRIAAAGTGGPGRLPMISASTSMEPRSIYGRLAKAADLNAGEVVTVGGVDGAPFTKDSHRTLYRPVAQHVKTMLPVDQEER
jgi:hypothetical protein